MGALRYIYSPEERAKRETEKAPISGESKPVSVLGLLFGQQPETGGALAMMFGNPDRTTQALPYSTAVRIAQSGGRFGNRRFKGNTPGPIRTSQVATAITNGWEFKWYALGGKVAGYNIYRSTINNPNVASRVDWIAQPQNVTRFSQLRWQETTAGTPYYWVSAVNFSGKEGARVPMNAVNAPPQAQPATVNDIDQGERGSGGGGNRKYEIGEIQ
jgi:hypothetical protein